MSGCSSSCNTIHLSQGNAVIALMHSNTSPVGLLCNGPRSEVRGSSSGKQSVVTSEQGTDGAVGTESGEGWSRGGGGGEAGRSSQHPLPETTSRPSHVQINIKLAGSSKGPQIRKLGARMASLLDQGLFLILGRAGKSRAGSDGRFIMSTATALAPNTGLKIRRTDKGSGGRRKALINLARSRRPPPSPHHRPFVAGMPAIYRRSRRAEGRGEVMTTGAVAQQIGKG